MTREHFAELVETYGADPRRWPQHEREMSMAYQEANPREAEAVLHASRRLDAALDGYVVPGPGARLALAIIEAAPPLRRAARRMRIWRQGASFAALGLAGALAGALAIAVLMPMMTPMDEDGAYAMTAFSTMTQTADE